MSKVAVASVVWVMGVDVHINVIGCVAIIGPVGEKVTQEDNVVQESGIRGAPQSTKAPPATKMIGRPVCSSGAVVLREAVVVIAKLH